jgi:hypothetical protein
VNKQADNRIDRLSGHLQANLLALRGKVLGPSPHFRGELLIPVAVVVAATLLFTFSTKARKSLVLKTAMFVSTRLLQRAAEKEVEGIDHEEKE